MGAENTKDIPDDIHLLQCMREMTLYLPVLEDPNFAPGEFSPPQKTKSGSIIMPYVIFGDVAEVFIATAYDCGWVLRGFDWVTWAQSEESKELCSDPSALAREGPMQLLCLVTALIRQDRFSEGMLLGAFKSRVILGIVRRAATIIEEERRRSQG